MDSVMVIELPDGTKAVVKCTEEAWDRAVITARDKATFSVLVTLVHDGRLKRYDLLAVELQRQRAKALRTTGQFPRPSIPPTDAKKEAK